METVRKVHYKKSFQEISEKINFVGFERRKIHIEKEDNIFKIWILFRYPLKEMNKEKKRVTNFIKRKKMAEKKYIFGKIEYEKGNYDKTRQLWKTSCDTGNMEGCNGLVLLERKKRKQKEKATEIKRNISSKEDIYTNGYPGKAIVLGDMDYDVIKNRLLEYLPQFRYCYQKVLDQQAKSFNGMVRMDFVIGASGHITKTELSSISGRLPASVQGCIVKTLKEISFSKN